MLREVQDIRSLAVDYSNAVARAGELAQALDVTIADLRALLVQRARLVERRQRQVPFEGVERRRGW